MISIDRQFRVKRLFPIGCVLCLSACGTSSQRYTEAFVHWDAASDAMSSAEERCGGDAYVVADRRGYSPDDYRCEPKQGSKTATHGGTQMTFVPQGKGAIATIPVNTGAPSTREVIEEGEPVAFKKANQPCRDIISGTGGEHLRKVDCPHLDFKVRKSIAIIVRNEQEASRNCPSGKARLRSGGNVDRLENYVCTTSDGTPLQKE